MRYPFPAVAGLIFMAVPGGAAVGRTQPGVDLTAETVWIPMTETPAVGPAREIRLDDRNYGPGAVQSYHRVFIQGGGTAELRLVPPISHDGHILLPGAVTVWQTAVRDFLARIGVDSPGN